ncbi:HNH endonuclease [Fervidibacillus halotolerans]|uniref:HNH endonuclease n=1 Tax=Fervidibacillus halotolerans TaxID=2980027 RepID=A0A9E8RZI9_9BACI|nr:HNH endonuclease [Fervidibacillus halotolerans]WAA13398.1 HNH endonuclease [Fervidibacillus halotolerans]
MKELKTCSNCKRELEINRFYNKERSLCIDCERDTAKTRMREYYSTLHGKAYQALQSARKTIRRNNYHVHDDLTVDQLVEAFEFFDHCAYCEKPFDNLSDRSIDHIVPLSKGGANTISNICIVHRNCNAKKQDKSVADVFGDEKANEIDEYMKFQRADDEVIEKISYYLDIEAKKKADKPAGYYGEFCRSASYKIEKIAVQLNKLREVI